MDRVGGSAFLGPARADLAATGTARRKQTGQSRQVSLGGLGRSRLRTVYDWRDIMGKRKNRDITNGAIAMSRDRLRTNASRYKMYLYFYPTFHEREVHLIDL